MALLDVIFGRGMVSDARTRNQILPLRDSFAEDKEVITVDPNEPLPDPPNRPPIIFENGLI